MGMDVRMLWREGGAEVSGRPAGRPIRSSWYPYGKVKALESQGHSPC